ncbi:MAG: (Fe-S)-binding protein [Bradymonadaceae bacterium]
MNTFSADIDRDTSYCTYCPKMCRFSCPASAAEDRETVTPWGMMRLFRKVDTGDVAPSDDVAEIFYHCTGCRRCGEWCEHDNDVPRALWKARRWMRELGHTPDVLQDFPARFFENRSPHDELPSLSGPDRRVDEVFATDAPVVFMPDCTTRRGEPERVEAIGALLEEVGGTKAALHTRRGGEGSGCCGFPLLAAGDERGYQGHRVDLDRELARAEIVVAECAGMVALARDGTSWETDGSTEPIHLVEYLLDHLDASPPCPVDADGLMLHDSCVPGRQLGLHDDVRDLLDALTDGEIGEFEYARDEAPCCGARGHYPTVAPEAAATCAEGRLEDLTREGGRRLVCTSSTCRAHFRESAEEPERIVDIVDVALEAYGVEG